MGVEARRHELIATSAVLMLNFTAVFVDDALAETTAVVEFVTEVIVVPEGSVVDRM